MPEQKETAEDSIESRIEIIDLKGAMERAHTTGERASQQFTKLLGVIHGGLGVILAAWLQRIFEAVGGSPRSSLAWYLALALACAAVGLVTLVLAAIIDQVGASVMVKEVGLVKRRVIMKQRFERAQHMEATERAAELDHCKKEDGVLDREATRAGARAVLLNNVSVWIGLSSWLCVVAAFVTLAVGVVREIDRNDHAAHPAPLQPAAVPPKAK
jgi:hypothetical protein